jgi:hydroxymethylglutaryl-CoA reductase
MTALAPAPALPPARERGRIPRLADDYGTGLPAQRQCPELLGCYGGGKVRKPAEIVAATVLCGEISLGAAVVADEWAAAHQRLGRNRPTAGQ